MSSQNKDEGGWAKSVWDSERKEFLGRTGTSWCEYEFNSKHRSAVITGAFERHGGCIGM